MITILITTSLPSSPTTQSQTYVHKGVVKTTSPIYALARTTCLRVVGNETEVLFDKYIATDEKILNYLTRYSGIEEGMLDRKTSKLELAERKVF